MGDAGRNTWQKGLREECCADREERRGKEERVRRENRDCQLTLSLVARLAYVERDFKKKTKQKKRAKNRRV